MKRALGRLDRALSAVQNALPLTVEVRAKDPELYNFANSLYANVEDARRALYRLEQGHSRRDPTRSTRARRDPPRWWGVDYVEKQANLWHNRLAHIILYGIDARGRENLREADSQLAALLEQKVPGNQKHRIARWWHYEKTKLSRMWTEAVEVAQGTRAPKLRGSR